VPEVTDSEACAAGVTEGEVVEPIVMLVVDQSGSMDDPYDPTRDGETRWGDLVDVLFNQTNGVVWTLQNQIQFGMALYTNDRSGTCPDLQWEYPALNNYGPLNTLASDNGPDAWTPTGESVVAVTDYLATLPNDRPKYILLATDGEPNLCRNDNLTGTALAAKAAAYAFAHDVRLFMLSVGEDIADAHMQDVANAGAGCPVNSFYDDVDTCNLSNSTCRNKQNDVTDYSDYDPWVVKCPDDSTGVPINHPFYKATTRAKLVEDLNTVLGSVLSCVVRLDATAGAPPVSGNVYVDGETIPQDQSDGWTITGPDTVQLLGATCDAVTDGQSHFIAIDINECDYPE
jgi:hypothetical protein